MADDVKRESYGIEMGIIQDMFEAGDITRAQARALRRNVYVMSVDADASPLSGVTSCRRRCRA